MSRKIEPGQELSQADYDWLAERQRVDEALVSWECTLGEGVGPQDEVRTETEPAINLTALQEEPPAKAPAPGDVATFDGAAPVVTEDEDDDSEEGETEEVPPYEEWKKADMLAEIERRNADRSEEDKIEPDDEKNATLAAALYADDEAHPDEDSTESSDE